MLMRDENWKARTRREDHPITAAIQTVTDKLVKTLLKDVEIRHVKSKIRKDEIIICKRYDCSYQKSIRLYWQMVRINKIIQQA